MKSEVVYAVRAPGAPDRYLTDSYHQRRWSPFKHQARTWLDLEKARAAASVHGGEAAAFRITEITPDGEILD